MSANREELSRVMAAYLKWKHENDGMRLGSDRKVTPSTARLIEKLQKEGKGSTTIQKTLSSSGIELSRTTITRVMNNTEHYKKERN